MTAFERAVLLAVLLATVGIWMDMVWVALVALIQEEENR